MRNPLRSIPPSVRGKPVVRRAWTFEEEKPQRKPWVFATKPKFARIQYREPLVDVFDEADEINIILDLPGFKEEEIHWEVIEGILKLSAKSLGREWEEAITLPAEVDTKNIKTKYRNEILEITLAKKTTQTPKGQKTPKIKRKNKCKRKF